MLSFVIWLSPLVLLPSNAWILTGKDAVPLAGKRQLSLGSIRAPRLDQIRDEDTVAWQSRADAIFSEKDSRPVILFDGVCNMCNGGVNFALDWDPDGNFRFAALQSPTGRALLRRAGREPDDISSIVLVDDSAAYIKSDAILRIARKLNLPFPFLGSAGLFFPKLPRDVFYDVIAQNRYRVFGRSQSCRLSDDRFEARFISDKTA